MIWVNVNYVNRWSLLKRKHVFNKTFGYIFFSGVFVLFYNAGGNKFILGIKQAISCGETLTFSWHSVSALSGEKKYIPTSLNLIE